MSNCTKLFEYVMSIPCSKPPGYINRRFSITHYGSAISDIAASFFLLVQGAQVVDPAAYSLYHSSPY